MIFAPIVDGSTPLRSQGQAFLAGFQARVAAGLLTGRPHPRSKYSVTSSDPEHLHVRAANSSTAVNVGLNEVDLSVPEAGMVRYRVEYWRWAKFVVGLGCVLGIVGATLLLVFDARTYIANHPASRIPSLTVGENVAVAWAMVIFWGFVWPWLLIALHRRPVRRLIERLIAEVDVAVAAAR
jgi:hypothetical protein